MSSRSSLPCILYSDTLSPQAFGAQQYRELGLLAIRGSVASLVLVILPLTVVLWVWMPDILVQGLGQDEEASRVAADFYRVYSVGLPAYALYCIVWKFLSAQSILWPLVVSTLVSTLLVFPVALTVLLQEGSGGGGLFFFHGHFEGVANTATNNIGNVNMGTDEQQAAFLAPAAAISIYYMSQCLLVLLLVWYWQPHHPATWPKGFLWDATVWRQALAWQPLSQYLSLGLGGILTYLEWVYWEALSLMVGTFGVVPLSAHAIPSQVLDVAYMIPWGMGIALSIRLGQVLASSSVKLDKNQSLSFRITSTRNAIRNSKLLAVTALLVSVLVFGVGALVLYQAQDWIVVRLFTHNENKDASVAELCRQIWGHVALLFFVLGMYAMVIGIAVGLGLQWTLGIVTVVCLWCVGIPTAYWFAVQRQGGLVAAWSCFWPPYLLINGIMCLVFFVTTDWKDVVDEIQQREQQQQQEAKEGQGEHTKEHESQP